MDAMSLSDTLQNENESITDQMHSFTRRLPDTTQVRLFSTFVECHLLAEIRHASSVLRDGEGTPLGLIEKLNREVSRVHCELQHFLSVWGKFESRLWPRAFASDMKRLIVMFDAKVALEEEWLFPNLSNLSAKDRQHPSYTLCDKYPMTAAVA